MSFPNILTFLFLTLSLSMHAQEQAPKVVADPYAEDDGSWIGIAGTVEKTGAGDFVLNYGDGTITVELAEESTTIHTFMKDERVTVFGVVDENFFSSTRIQARAVFVESMSTYVHTVAGSVERLKKNTPTLVSGAMVQGRVTAVTEKHLIVDKGDRMITVDLSWLPEKKGSTSKADRVREGDMVTAIGDMDRTFWKDRVLRATSLEVVPVPEY